MKYRKAYEWGKSRLIMAGIEEAALDARLLLEYVCSTTHNDLYARSEMELKPFMEEAYERYIMLRSEHVPLQHITGEQEFMGLSFKVNKDVLVPRQDTEILVEEAMIATEDGDRVLDMCTGSGCIILSLMKYKNNIKGVGADISPEALLVAKDNAERLKDEINGSISFIQTDLFENINDRFDVILSNPPYIRSGEIPLLQNEVREHDPVLALDGGDDGLVFYRRIIGEAHNYLEDEGRLIMEIGFDQAAEVMELLEEAGYGDIRVIKDLSGLDRVVYARYEGDGNV